MANLGIPEIASKQQFKFMDEKFKKLLSEKIDGISLKSGLEEIYLNTFIWQLDKKT